MTPLAFLTPRRAATVVLSAVTFAFILIAVSPIDARASTQKHLQVKKSKKTQKTPTGESYAKRVDLGPVANDIALRHNLDLQWVRHVLAKAQYFPSIAKAVTPPAVGVAKNWAIYRSRFIEPKRIRAGVAFWHTHQATLERAERETGVPAELIVGIIGVETIYGQQTGNFRVLDALAEKSGHTLGVDAKSRAYLSVTRGQRKENGGRYWT